MQTVEFLGIPGAGKSTLSAEVHHALMRSGIEVFTLREAMARAMQSGVGDRVVDPIMARLPKGLLSRYSESGFIRSNALMVSLIEFMAAHPSTVAAFLDGQARRADYEVGGDLTIRWFVQLLARFQLAGSALGRDEVLLLDEGFAQRAVTGFAHRFSADDQGDIDRYIGTTPRPTLLIHLDLPVEVAVTRVTFEGGAEPTKRLRGSDADPVQFLEDADRCVAYVVASARAAGWEVLELDASTAIGEQREAVVTRLGGVPSTD